MLTFIKNIQKHGYDIGVAYDKDWCIWKHRDADYYWNLQVAVLLYVVVPSTN